MRKTIAVVMATMEMSLTKASISRCRGETCTRQIRRIFASAHNLLGAGNERCDGANERLLADLDDNADGLAVDKRRRREKQIRRLDSAAGRPVRRRPTRLRLALARQRRVVDLGVDAAEHDEVGGNTVARGEHDNVTDHDVAGWHGRNGAVADDLALGRRHGHERCEGVDGRLDLTPFDERVQEAASSERRSLRSLDARDGQQDRGEPGVGQIGVEVDAEQHIFEDRAYDEEHVEELEERVHVLLERRAALCKSARARQTCVRTLGGLSTFLPSRASRAAASAADRPRDLAGAALSNEVSSFLRSSSRLSKCSSMSTLASATLTFSGCFLRKKPAMVELARLFLAEGRSSASSPASASSRRSSMVCPGQRASTLRSRTSSRRMSRSRAERMVDSRTMDRRPPMGARDRGAFASGENASVGAPVNAGASTGVSPASEPFSVLPPMLDAMLVVPQRQQAHAERAKQLVGWPREVRPGQRTRRARGHSAQTEPQKLERMGTNADRRIDESGLKLSHAQKSIRACDSAFDSTTAIHSSIQDRDATNCTLPVPSSPTPTRHAMAPAGGGVGPGGPSICLAGFASGSFAAFGKAATVIGSGGKRAETAHRACSGTNQCARRATVRATTKDPDHAPPPA